MRACVLVVALWLAAPCPARAQISLGNKVLGTLGLDAATQPSPGVYLSDRVVYYGASTVRDRDGNELPVGLDLDAVANAFGVAGFLRLPWEGAVAGVVLALPLAHVEVNTRRPEASIDRFGLGDLFVQPLWLGWRRPRLDLAASYAVYLPTGRFEPGGGLSRGHVTHQFSAGATVAFDAARSWRASALASYELNQKKRGLDLTRGDTFQLQGGVGWTFRRVFDVGLAGYALWQVRDDRGTDVPPVLRGARDQAFGVGPELGLSIPKARLRLSLRYTRDVRVRSRPQGQVAFLGLTWSASARPSARER